VFLERKPRTLEDVERDMLKARDGFHMGHFDEMQRLADERRKLLDDK
jgi:hypothetical protein